MAQSPSKTDCRRVFSVVQIGEKTEEQPVKLVLSDNEASELVRKMSKVNSEERDTILTQIKLEEEVHLPRRRSSLMQAFRGSRPSLHKEGLTRLLPTEDAYLSIIAEQQQQQQQQLQLQNGKKRPVEKTKHYTKRLVEKNGSSNVIPRLSKRYRFLNDFYTTLSDLKWKYCLLLSIAANIFTWTLFALAYYLIIWIHRDIANKHNPDWDPCILNVNSFVTCFLFSIETQHTIGYGFRAIKDNCPSALIVWNFQSYIAILISSLFCGLIVLKIMSPQYRSKLIRFSRKAVVSFNNGVPSFIFRIIDLKESNLVNCNVKAVLIRDHVTKEGEFIPFYNRSLSLTIDETTGSDLFLAWPVNVIHVIDSQSPLYGLTPKMLQDEYLEIIVFLEGVVENSGKLMQVRTSYTSSEILWGASFSPMLTFNATANKFEMDYEYFDEIQLSLPLIYLPTANQRPQ